MTSPLPLRSLAAPLCILLAVAVFAGLSPTFIGLENLANIGSQMWVLALLAVGQMFAIASRGFDISVGSVAALSSTVAALAANALGLPGLLAGAVAGLACGTLNGVLVGVFGLQPVVATLGVLIGAKGVALLVSGDGQVVPLAASDAAARLAFDPVAGLPLTAWVAVLAILAAAWVLHAAAGRRILMLGSHPEAVPLVGVSPARTQVLAYQLSGLFAGLAGVLMTVRAGSGLPTEGAGMELQSIAAAVIGGTPLSGGAAGVLGVVLGAGFIQVLLTGLNLMGVSPFVAQSAIGVVIIGSGLLAVLVKSATSSPARTKGTSA